MKGPIFPNISHIEKSILLPLVELEKILSGWRRTDNSVSHNPHITIPDLQQAKYLFEVVYSLLRGTNDYF